MSSPELRGLDGLDLLGTHPAEAGAPNGHKQGTGDVAFVVQEFLQDGLRAGLGSVGLGW